jgi:hypothetical protein
MKLLNNNNASYNQRVELHENEECYAEYYSDERADSDNFIVDENDNPIITEYNPAGSSKNSAKKRKLTIRDNRKRGVDLSKPPPSKKGKTPLTVPKSPPKKVELVHRADPSKKTQKKRKKKHDNSDQIDPDEYVQELVEANANESVDINDLLRVVNEISEKQRLGLRPDQDIYEVFGADCEQEQPNALYSTKFKRCVYYSGSDNQAAANDHTFVELGGDHQSYGYIPPIESEKRRRRVSRARRRSSKKQLATKEGERGRESSSEDEWGQGRGQEKLMEKQSNS